MNKTIEQLNMQYKDSCNKEACNELKSAIDNFFNSEDLAPAYKQSIVNAIYSILNIHKEVDRGFLEDLPVGNNEDPNSDIPEEWKHFEETSKVDQNTLRSCRWYGIDPPCLMAWREWRCNPSLSPLQVYCLTVVKPDWDNLLRRVGVIGISKLRSRELDGDVLREYSEVEKRVTDENAECMGYCIPYRELINWRKFLEDPKISPEKAAWLNLNYNGISKCMDKEGVSEARSEFQVILRGLTQQIKKEFGTVSHCKFCGAKLLSTKQCPNVNCRSHEFNSEVETCVKYLVNGGITELATAKEVYHKRFTEEVIIAAVRRIGR